MVESALLIADWPAPGNIRAFTTLRSGPGVSAAPFDRFNLGANSDDDPVAVMENRRRLTEIAHLPSEPCWLRQVHGTAVADLDSLVPVDGPTLSEPQRAQEIIADASRTSRPACTTARGDSSDNPAASPAVCASPASRAPARV